MALTLWRWRIRDPKRRSGWRELSWAMDEKTALERYGDQVERIEGSSFIADQEGLRPSGGPKTPGFGD